MSDETYIYKITEYIQNLDDQYTFCQKILGQGAQGTVYLYREIGSQKELAIKKIKIQQIDSLPAFSTNIKREIDLLTQKLDHDKICKLQRVMRDD